MLVEDFNRTVDVWIDALSQYSFEQLCTQPAPGSWSLGQVYMHLIDATDYNIKQMHACFANDDNATKEALQTAKAMFLKNDFPDIIIDGPPSNAFTPQPPSKQQLIDGLMNLKKEVKALEHLLAATSSIGKAKHPGLGYFTAHEWLQFAGMHFRHHLRQKKRIDEFLKVTAAS